METHLFGDTPFWKHSLLGRTLFLVERTPLGKTHTFREEQPMIHASARVRVTEANHNMCDIFVHVQLYTYAYKRLAQSIKDNKSRFLLGDFNMAAYTVADLLRACGVDCELLEYHVELATARSNKGVLSMVEGFGPDGVPGNVHHLFDTVGIWALGPMGDYGCDSTSPWAHTLAGLCHPFPSEKGVNTRGYAVHKHKWKGTMPVISFMDDDTVAVLVGILDDINLILLRGGSIFDYYKGLPDKLPDKLRAYGLDLKSLPSRLRVGAGFGFGNMNHPGFRGGPWPGRSFYQQMQIHLNHKCL